MTDVSPTLLRNLVNLRWCAVGGQALTIALVPRLLDIRLDATPLWAGVAVLAAFNVWAAWRNRARVRISVGDVVAHLCIDIAVLTWLIACSGGAMNPFAPLFLLPIALAAVALPRHAVGTVAALCCAGYASSALFGKSLPHAHDGGGDAFALHLAGMGVMFAISAAVITFFLTRLAHALRAREHELARLREQFARNEGIVALATHAAAVAHELNTPLATLTLMLEDQRADRPDASPARDEVETMTALVDICRDRVRELAAPAAMAGDAAASIERVVERWRLLRPGIALERSGELGAASAFALDAGIGHLLLALLNNAADAGERAGRPRVALHLQTESDALRGSVRDYGAGFDAGVAEHAGALFRSTKRDGLGVGLALSHATVERLGGELSLQRAHDGGTRVAFRLPLRAAVGAAR